MSHVESPSVTNSEMPKTCAWHALSVRDLEGSLMLGVSWMRRYPSGLSSEAASGHSYYTAHISLLPAELGGGSPSLMHLTGVFKADVLERAKRYMSRVAGGVGAYSNSQGISAVREVRTSYPQMGCPVQTSVPPISRGSL